MAANIVFVDEGSIDAVFSRKDNNLNETWIVLEAAKMTEEKKTVMVKRKAKKKPKKTTGSLVTVLHEGLTSWLIKG